MANDFTTLLKIKQGKLDPDGVVFDDEFIDDIDKDNIYFEFPNTTDALMYFLDMEEGDALNYVSQYVGNYFDLYDCYNTEEDYDEGYVIGSLTEDEDIELLYKIISTIAPDMSSFLKKEDGKWVMSGERIISQTIKQLFPNVADKMEDLYCQAKEESMQVGFSNYTNAEFEKLKKILDTRWFTEFELSIDDLLNMYLSANKLQYDIKDIISNYLGKKDLFRSESYRAMYENEDAETFNRVFSPGMYSILDGLYDEIIEGETYNPEYFETVDKIQKIGGFSKTYQIPSTSTESAIQVNIEGVDPETNKLQIVLRKIQDGTRFIKRGKVTVDSLLSILNNQQLFDIFD